MATKEAQQIGWKFDDGDVRRSSDEPSRDDSPVAFDGILRRNADIEIRAVDSEERTFEIVCSSESIDSHGDVVKQNFNLKRYKKNPVVLFLHNRFGLFDGARPEDFLPVGHSQKVRLEDGNLVARFHIIKGTAEQEPFVDKLWRRIEQKALRAASIGFVPGKVTEVTDKHGNRKHFELDENDLYEISLVPIPSNPDAVGKMAAMEKQFLSRLAAKSSPGAPAEDIEDMTKEDYEKAIQAKADAEAKAKTLEADLEKAKDDHQKALEAATAKVKALEEKSSELEAENETLKTKNEELAESVKAQKEAQEAREKAEKEAAEKAEKEAAAADVEEALKAKVAPAKHEEKRAKWTKMRERSADDFKEFIEELPDLPHEKQIVKDKGASDDGKSALAKALKKAEGED